MQIFSRNEVEALRVLVPLVAEASPGGISPMKLSDLTDLPQQRVEALLERHRDYFVRVGGGEAFALNRFGPHGASVERIAEDIERRWQEGRRWRAAGIALLVMTVAVVVLTR